MTYSAEERALMKKLAIRANAARTKKLSPARRKEIAVNAIQARWKRVRDAQAQAPPEAAA